MTALERLREWMDSKDKSFAICEDNGYGATSFTVELSGRQLDVKVVNHGEPSDPVVIGLVNYIIVNLQNGYYGVIDSDASGWTSYENTLNAALDLWEFLLAKS